MTFFQHFPDDSSVILMGKSWENHLENFSKIHPMAPPAPEPEASEPSEAHEAGRSVDSNQPKGQT